MTEDWRFIPQFVLTQEGQFLPWEDYVNRNLKKKYSLTFSRTHVFVNGENFAIKSNSAPTSETVKSIYRQDDRSLVVYTNGWTKLDTGKESIIGFLI